MAILRWRDEFATGVTQFDKEHRKIVQMINDLIAAISDKREKHSVKRILESLFSYTKYHFGNEEKLMQQRDYPYFDEHKKQHDELAAQVMEFQKQFENDAEGTTREVYQTLRKWLSEHILESDMKYGPYLGDEDASEI